MARSQTRIGPLTDDQLGDAAKALGRAYQEDPLFIAIYPDPTDRAFALPIINRWYAQQTSPFGMVESTIDESEGAIVAYRSRDLEDGEAHMADSIGELIHLLGPDLWQPFDEIKAWTYADNLLREAVPGPHWCLHILGVDPDRQGHGIGGALLDRLHAAADSDELPTILVTFHPRNAPWFVAHE